MELFRTFLCIFIVSIAYADIEKTSQSIDWTASLITSTEAMPESIRTFAQSIAERTTDEIKMQFVDKAVDKSEDKIYIFVSQSLTTAQIRFALTESAKHQQCIVVFYGLKQDQTIPQFSHWLHDLARNINGKPKAIIDPLLFEQHHISSVPTMLLLTNNKSKKLTGILDVETLLDNQDAQSDLGQIKPVLEKSFIRIIKDKINAYPWNTWKTKAKEQFWLNKRSITLAPATTSTKRIINANVQVMQDIISPTGALVAHKGDMINQLALIPMTRQYIVINPMRVIEVDWLKQYAHALPIPAMIMLANLPSDYSWRHHHNLQHTLDAPIYLLTTPVKQRFQIRYTPSVIQAEDDHFIVTEVALDES